jgi:nucleoside diphosphate kinase
MEEEKFKEDLVEICQGPVIALIIAKLDVFDELERLVGDTDLDLVKPGWYAMPDLKIVYERFMD